MKKCLKELWRRDIGDFMNGKGFRFGSRTREVNRKVMEDRANGNYKSENNNSIDLPQSNFGKDGGLLIATGSSLYAFDPFVKKAYRVDQRQNRYKAIGVFNGDVVALGENIYRVTSGIEVIPELPPGNFHCFESIGDHIYLGGSSGILGYNVNDDNTLFENIAKRAVRGMCCKNDVLIDIGSHGMYVTLDNVCGHSGYIRTLATFDGKLIVSIPMERNSGNDNPPYELLQLRDFSKQDPKRGFRFLETFTENIGSRINVMSEYDKILCCANDRKDLLLYHDEGRVFDAVNIYRNDPNGSIREDITSMISVTPNMFKEILEFGGLL
jgi:hypothetical protein